MPGDGGSTLHPSVHPSALLHLHSPPSIPAPSLRFILSHRFAPPPAPSLPSPPPFLIPASLPPSPLGCDGSLALWSRPLPSFLRKKRGTIAWRERSRGRDGMEERREEPQWAEPGTGSKQGKDLIDHLAFRFSAQSLSFELNSAQASRVEVCSSSRTTGVRSC